MFFRLQLHIVLPFSFTCVCYEQGLDVAFNTKQSIPVYCILFPQHCDVNINCWDGTVRSHWMKVYPYYVKILFTDIKKFQIKMNFMKKKDNCIFKIPTYIAIYAYQFIKSFFFQPKESFDCWNVRKAQLPVCVFRWWVNHLCVNLKIDQRCFGKHRAIPFNKHCGSLTKSLGNLTSVVRNRSLERLLG